MLQFNVVWCIRSRREIVLTIQSDNGKQGYKVGGKKYRRPKVVLPRGPCERYSSDWIRRRDQSCMSSQRGGSSFTLPLEWVIHMTHETPPPLSFPIYSTTITSIMVHGQVRTPVVVNRSVTTELSTQCWAVCHMDKAWKLTDQEPGPSTAERYKRQWTFSQFREPPWTVRSWKSLSPAVNGRYKANAGVRPCLLYSGMQNTWVRLVFLEFLFMKSINLVNLSQIASHRSSPSPAASTTTMVQNFPNAKMWIPKQVSPGNLPCSSSS